MFAAQTAHFTAACSHSSPLEHSASLHSFIWPFPPLAHLSLPSLGLAPSHLCFLSLPTHLCCLSPSLFILIFTSLPPLSPCKASFLLLPLALMLECCSLFSSHLSSTIFLPKQFLPSLGFPSFSLSLLTFHLITFYACGCSVNLSIFFLPVSFPLFLSFSPSCLPLRQPEYDNVISHSSTALSPLSFSHLLRLCLFALSLSFADSAVVLHVSLPHPFLLYSHQTCTHTSLDRS